MKKIVIIQARMSSSRFPGKVLKKLAGKALINWIVSAAQNIDLADEVIVATSNNPEDDAIAKHCKKNKFKCFRGDHNNVLKRYYDAAKKFKATHIVRLTADCPLIDPALCSQILLMLVEYGYDYVSNVAPPSWPDGYDCEAFTFKALEQAMRKSVKLSDKEHVTSYIRGHAYDFKTANVPCPIPGLNDYRWTVDSPQDLVYLEKLLKKTKGKHTLSVLIEAIKRNKNLKQPKLTRNHSFEKQISSEMDTNSNFTKSQILLKESLKYIPLGSQTFSKSYIQYPKNTSPHFLSHGNGSRVWDVDGNEYVDLVNALLPNILGYADPDVNFAVQAQLQKGVSMSLATELEVNLAKKLCQIIPSAQKVRFGKNGTDATSAAIRLARAFTGRDKIIVCGYHGWQDWSIGTTSRNLGIPKSVCDLSVSVSYNNLQEVEKLLSTEEFACMIMEPANLTPPNQGYLKTIRSLCEKHGTLLVFDETITGFRFSMGGAQSYFNITPDLSCFGKGMANGFPLSAIVGRDDIMKKMEDIFFSGTFGGENLSLAASLATIEKLEKKKVIDHLWKIGQALHDTVARQIEKYDLTESVSLNGYAPWKILSFKDHINATSFEIKTFFMQEIIRRGILIIGSHNVSYSFGMNELQETIEAYEGTLEILSKVLRSNQLKQKLQSPSIQPLFKVR